MGPLFVISPAKRTEPYSCLPERTRSLSSASSSACKSAIASIFIGTPRHWAASFSLQRTCVRAGGFCGSFFRARGVSLQRTFTHAPCKTHRAFARAFVQGFAQKQSLLACALEARKRSLARTVAVIFCVVPKVSRPRAFGTSP